MAKIQRALLSVSDKTGLVPFAQILAAAGVELVSTGGTARTLREAGLAVKDISEHTGFPEMLDGRVKTLHPKVHGGLLFIRGDENHEATVREHGISPIDLVVVNLYPFEQTVAKPDVSLHDAIENIDIGGPSMLRSAAKNHASVTVVVDPRDYAEVSGQIKEDGNTTLELRRKLAAKVFARTAAYDGAIAAHLQKEFKSAPDSGLPALLSISAPLVQPLRYGENPHQNGGALRQIPRFFPAASRQGTFLQQHPGFDGGGKFNRRIRVRPAFARLRRGKSPDPRDSQTHESVWRRSRHRSARGLGQGICDGQTGAFWRYHCREPHAGWRVCGRDRGNFQ